MKYFVVAALSVALLGLPGRGDDCMQSTCSSTSTFTCANQCPLAQMANLHRSFGRESQAVSKIARAEFASALERNLSRI